MLSNCRHCGTTHRLSAIQRQSSSATSVCSRCAAQNSIYPQQADNIRRPVTSAAIRSASKQSVANQRSAITSQNTQSTGSKIKRFLSSQNQPPVLRSVAKPLSSNANNKPAKSNKSADNKKVFSKTNPISTRQQLLSESSSGLVKKLAKEAPDQELWAVQLLASEDRKQATQIPTGQFNNAASQPKLNEISLQEALAEIGIEDAWALELLDERDKFAMYQSLVQEQSKSQKDIS
jgi:hypothetical protein